MTSDAMARIKQTLSATRLDSYGSAEEADLVKYARYLRNIDLSLHFYRLLNIYEVALRNALHNALSEFYESSRWFSDPRVHEILEMRQRQEISTVWEKKPDLTPDQMVSRLMLGFWTSLLNKPFEEPWWHHKTAGGHILLVRAFPYLPKHLRTRKAVYGRSRLANELRNRISHHEAIWNRPNLSKDYADILEALEWIDPTIASSIRIFGEPSDLIDIDFEPYLSQVKLLLSQLDEELSVPNVDNPNLNRG